MGSNPFDNGPFTSVFSQFGLLGCNKMLQNLEHLSDRIKMQLCCCLIDGNVKQRAFYEDLG